MTPPTVKEQNMSEFQQCERKPTAEACDPVDGLNGYDANGRVAAQTLAAAVNKPGLPLYETVPWWKRRREPKR